MSITNPKKIHSNLSSSMSPRIIASKIGKNSLQLVLKAIKCSVSYELTNPENTTEDIKYKIAHTSGFPNCFKFRSQIQ